MAPVTSFLLSCRATNWEDDEILRFVNAPLFTGCAGRNRVWQKGNYFCQGDNYWIFLILLLTGMRIGEPAQIALDDIVKVEQALDDGSVILVHFSTCGLMTPPRDASQSKA